MEATRYYDLLINGYMREIEHHLKLIPDDIKALCIAFHYKFLVYNQYCTVKYKKKFDAPRLLIQSCPETTPMDAPFGGRLVSRVPINSNNDCAKLKVKLKMNETFTSAMASHVSSSTEFEEFLCVAINDFYASVTDELDLKEGEEYTIMQTSPSGWWYAVNSDGEDGWIPSNYLERKDADGQIIFGITTDPELFMNAPLMEHPFKGGGVVHAVYRSKGDMIEVVDGKRKNQTAAQWRLAKGYEVLDIWIEDTMLRMGKGKNKRLVEKDLLSVNLNYYFAMAFTATVKKIISFEISGDFV